MTILGILVMAVYSDVLSEKATRQKRFAQKHNAKKHGKDSNGEYHYHREVRLWNKASKEGLKHRSMHSKVF